MNKMCSVRQQTKEVFACIVLRNVCVSSIFAARYNGARKRKSRGFIPNWVPQRRIGRSSTRRTSLQSHRVIGDAGISSPPFSFAASTFLPDENRAHCALCIRFCSASSSLCSSMREHRYCVAKSREPHRGDSRGARSRITRRGSSFFFRDV